MMVTTGGRGARSSGLSSVSEMNSSSSNPTFSTFQPWSMASRLAVSKSMGWFCVTIFPAAISLRIRSALFTPMVCDSSATVIVSSIRITFLCSDISVISVCLPFFALFFLWPRTGTYARCRASSTRSCLEIDSVFSTRGPFFPRCGAPLLSLVTSMNSRPRPGPPETTASSRTSPTRRRPGSGPSDGDQRTREDHRPRRRRAHLEVLGHLHRLDAPGSLDDGPRRLGRRWPDVRPGRRRRRGTRSDLGDPGGHVADLGRRPQVDPTELVGGGGLGRRDRGRRLDRRGLGRRLGRLRSRFRPLRGH